MDEKEKEKQIAQHEFDEQERKKALKATLELFGSGYAGVTKEGRIVDRREFPDALPIQENPMFHTPKPKPISP